MGTYAGFAALGALWGVWGASVPTVREQAGLSDGRLGTALLCIGAGALPAMLLAGRAVDRWGHRVTALLLLALGASGVAVAVTGQGLVSLSVGLGVLGATSGAVDVAINAAAGAAGRASDRPVVGRAHALFSVGVVVASLTTGALLALGSPVVVPFLLAAGAGGAAGIVVLLTTAPPAPPPAAAPGPGATGDDLRLLPLLAIGGLAAVGFAVENAHQSWSAAYLDDVQSAGPAVAAAGPAVFAAVVALTRFATAALGAARPTAVVVTGAGAAAAGTAVVAGAPNLPVALAGLAVAAAGTAVVHPTLLGLVTDHADEPARGRATSLVTTVAYLGFLAGPVYVGQWSAATDLPTAMLAVAALAALLALLARPTLAAVDEREVGAPAAFPTPRSSPATTTRPPRPV